MQTLEEFSALADCELVLRLDGQEWTADLIEAKPLVKHGEAEAREPFSLVFKTPVTGLPQASYELIAPGHPPTLLFLVPIGGDDSSSHLQAIFN